MNRIYRACLIIGNGNTIMNDHIQKLMAYRPVNYCSGTTLCFKLTLNKRGLINVLAS